MQLDTAEAFSILSFSLIERKDVKSCYHGNQILDHNNRELKQRRRQRQSELEKGNGFISAKQQLFTFIALLFFILPNIKHPK